MYEKVRTDWMKSATSTLWTSTSGEHGWRLLIGDGTVGPIRMMTRVAQLVGISRDLNFKLR
jgi:hypothetical protein